MRRLMAVHPTPHGVGLVRQFRKPTGRKAAGAPREGSDPSDRPSGRGRPPTEGLFQLKLDALAADEVFGRLAGPDEAVAPAVDEHLGWQGLGVVVARHHESVGAGDLDHQ